MRNNPELPVDGQITATPSIIDGGRRAEEIPDGGCINTDVLAILDDLDQ